MKLLSSLRLTVAAITAVFSLCLIAVNPASGRAVETRVISVAVPLNGTYDLNDVIDFTVNFDSNATVDTTDGVPRIALTIGSTLRYATYLHGSGTQQLAFRYQVVAGDLDSDGIAVGPSIDLNGAQIVDDLAIPVNLALNSIGTTSGVLINGGPAVIAVPTLTEWAMILMALALAGFAVFNLQRRRKLAL